jgi:hypothetical protein
MPYKVLVVYMGVSSSKIQELDRHILRPILLRHPFITWKMGMRLFLFSPEANSIRNIMYTKVQKAMDLAITGSPPPNAAPCSSTSSCNPASHSLPGNEFISFEYFSSFALSKSLIREEQTSSLSKLWCNKSRRNPSTAPSAPSQP